MTFKKLRTVLGTAVATLLTVYCFAAVAPARGAAGNPPARHRASKKVRKSHSSAHRSSTHRRSTSHRSSHHRSRRSASAAHSSFHQRFSKIHPQPERVDQIQEALIGAGDLEGPPTGKWDPATKAAMSHYQASNGFPVTGLPDAKSLMKLGLGPHPLPDSLAKNATQAQPAPSPDAASNAPE